MKIPAPILAALCGLLLAGCAAPGKSWPERALYRLLPETVSAGALVIPDRIRTDSMLVTVGATWRVKPAPVPVPIPAIFPHEAAGKIPRASLNE